MSLAGPGLPVGHDVAVVPVEEALDPLWHVVVIEHLLDEDYIYHSMILRQRQFIHNMPVCSQDL